MSNHVPRRIYNLECQTCGFKRALEVTAANESDVIHSRAIYCPHCNEVMPMVSSEDPDASGGLESLFDSRPLTPGQIRGKLNRGCFLLVFVVASFILVGVCFEQSEMAGSMALMVAVILQFVIMSFLKKNR